MHKLRKGIILAGGSGTRLYPITQAISKQLVPIYDKPMIYYPICTLLQAGIQDILLISTAYDLPQFQKFLGNGSNWGINISYAVQKNPDGIAQALIIAKEFINEQNCALILGDNIFYGYEFESMLTKAHQNNVGATIFAYHVQDPQRYGVVEFNQHNQAISLIEKPKFAKSNYAVTGLYFYDEQAYEIACHIKPSNRNELEITDINLYYLNNNQLNVQIMGRGQAWFDTGTHDSLLEANSFIATIQKRQGLMIACPEEIAFNKGLIDAKALYNLAQKLNKTNYGQYLLNLLQEKNIVN